MTISRIGSGLGSAQPMRGESLVPLLSGRTGRVHDDNYVTVLEHRNQSLVRQGRWKLTAVDSPFEESNFALFDLEADPGETVDLSGQLPEKRAELLEAWRQQRLELGIVLPQDL